LAKRLMHMDATAAALKLEREEQEAATKARCQQENARRAALELARRELATRGWLLRWISGAGQGGSHG
jgi:hypothetical protein